MALVGAVETLKFGQDINYPPYAFKDTTTGELSGFGADIARGINTMFSDNINIEIEQVLWSDCWSSAGGGTLGAKLEDGTLDACMTYTHTQGIRGKYAEFSGGILNVNKAAGLISPLKDGLPLVTGQDDLAGKTVVDVGGWAPTADGLGFVENKCSGKKYSENYTLLVGKDNDESLKMILNGTADAMFVYSDQAKNYQCKAGSDDTEWDCKMWAGFGTTFAYVQTGQFGYVKNGTTLALAKKGSGVANKLNPYLWSYMETKDYHDVCVKYNMTASCYPNTFFTAQDKVEKDYNKPTAEHKGDCSSGYCPCTGATDNTSKPSSAVETFKFGQDINYPPYAYKNTTTGELSGFGADIARGMNDMCSDIKIEIEQVAWSDCWSSAGGGTLGAKLENGTLDACMTYTHTQGIRGKYADFSGGILNVNKAAGLISPLKDGLPLVTGQDDLAGKTVVDVGGWAPTADGLGFVENKCSGKKYSENYTLLVGKDNDESLKMTLNGTADAMFVYSDQAKNYQCKTGVDEGEWDCKMWAGFGKTFAYVQTGQFGYVKNGTTLALTKKGSGVADKVNPCLWRFMETKEYHDVCVKYNMSASCYPNKYFTVQDKVEKDYNKPTEEHKGDCSKGYCPCTGATDTTPAPTTATPAPMTTTPAPTTADPALMTAAAPMKAGDSSIIVTTQSDYSIGQTVDIDKGTLIHEVRVIAGFGSLILNLPLEHDHPNGTTVVPRATAGPSDPCAPAAPVPVPVPAPASPCAPVAPSNPCATARKYDAEGASLVQQAGTPKKQSSMVPAWAFPLFGVLAMFSFAAFAGVRVRSQVFPRQIQMVQPTSQTDVPQEEEALLHEDA